MLDNIGWIGSILLAFCGLPQAIESYKTNLNIDLPPITGKVMLNLSVSKIPEDLGSVNNTTRPPINLEASITGYPIDIISSVNGESKWISMQVKIYKN